MIRIRDVVVVGAGPAGSATATVLAGHGFDVLLLDRAKFPRPKPCAEYLSPAASGILDQLGVLPRIEALAPARLAGMRVVSPDGTSFTGRFASGHGYRAHSDFGLALPREQLDQVLASHAAARGAEFRDGTGVESLDTGPDGARVMVRGPDGPETIRARLVIGADGLNSRIARRLGLARRGSRRRVALVTHLRDVAGMTDVGEMHVAANGYVGLAPVGAGVTNVAVVADLGRTDPVQPIAAWFARLLERDFPAVLQRVAGATQVSPIRGVGPFARWTRRASADRTLLVGDAADFHDPFTGEGIYAALAGAGLAAAQAARALVAGRCGVRDLADYDRERRSAFRGKWLFERAVSGAVAWPAMFNRIASRLARHQMNADLMVGAAGDFVPVSRLLRPSYVWQLVA